MTDQATILVIEDDPDILELIRFNLSREGFSVLTARSGDDGWRRASQTPPALIILDLMLPGMPGIEVCRALRGQSRTRHVPIIMLTAKAQESDVILGLELGADDYMTKPFSIRELLARVRAVLRRTAPGQAGADRGTPVTTGPLRIDPTRHEVLIAGSPVSLTLAEFRLLHVLARNSGRVMTRDELLDHITEGRGFILDRNIDVHVRSIRRKLGAHRNLIVTVRGVGYKYEPGGGGEGI